MLYTVAKLHYENEMSQVEIAKRLNVSTATISRLLQRARAEGIVRIEVRDPVAPGALASDLASKLGLKRAAVVEAPVNDPLPALADPLGQMLLDSALVPGSVLVVGWGRAIRTAIEVGLPRIAGVHVVAATGGMQQHEAHFQVNEFVRSAADQLGGTAHFIHAPYLPAREARDAFLADPAIRESVALWERIDVAVVGVGLPHAPNSRDARAVTPGELALAKAAGDVIRHYFDSDGRLVDWDGEERMIAASPEQLRKARLVVGLATGAEKAQAIIGAARARLVSALVTDVRTAEAILERL
jgi:DNA-binding transcriptional regulator LsrR (DeoR family)